MTIINTSARSLTPKIDSLIECFSELEVDIAVVTETWMRTGEELDRNLQDLSLGSGIGALFRNRAPNARGVAHGRVGVFFRQSVTNFKAFHFNNPDNFEVLPVFTTVRGSARKLVVVAAYIPPNYTVPRDRQCLEYIEAMVIQIRLKFRDPYVVVAGDFNQKDIAQALVEFPDISEVHIGPTRGERAIDRLFCNMTRGITSSGTVPPLETEAEEASRSDHLITYMTTKVHTRQAVEWVSYSYCQFSEDASNAFGRWIVGHDWIDVVMAEGSDRKAEVYQQQIHWAMDQFFPVRTTRRRSSDLPWINKAIKKKIRRRKRIYRKYGRSFAWKRLKKHIEEMLDERKKKIYGHEEAAVNRQGRESQFLSSGQVFQHARKAANL